MNLLVRWGTTLGLIGSTLLLTLFSGNIPVLALTEQQIKEKLDPVPVFLITNNQGVPLTRTVPNGQNAQSGQNAQKDVAVTDVFMSGQEAQAFITELRNTQGKDPKMSEMLKSLQVTPVPLGEIYQKLQDTAKKPNSLVFAFQPGRQEVAGAITLLRQSGKEVKQFPSVPVFIVKSEKGYVSIKRKADNQEVIPLFLSQKDAEGLLKQVKKQVAKADIQVVDIDGVINILREKNDAWLSQVALVPSSESVEYVATKRSNAPKPAGTGTQNRSPNAKPVPVAPKNKGLVR